jgi:hypothetical protein
MSGFEDIFGLDALDRIREFYGKGFGSEIDARKNYCVPTVASTIDNLDLVGNVLD